MNISNTQALQALEHQLQQLLVQKQSVRSKILELESAISAVQQTSAAYKAIGNVLVQKDPTALSSELSEEKERSSARFSALEKQEGRLLEKKKELQDAVRKDVEGDNHG